MTVVAKRTRINQYAFLAGLYALFHPYHLTRTTLIRHFSKLRQDRTGHIIISVMYHYSGTETTLRRGGVGALITLFPSPVGLGLN